MPNTPSLSLLKGMFFTSHAVNSFEDAKTSDLKMFSVYYKGMLEKGIYLAPSQFEAGFVSAAHSYEDIEETIAAAEAVMANLAV